MGVSRGLLRYVLPDPPPPNLVTYAELKRLGACGSQLARFKRTFGKSVLVTEELAVEHRDHFDLYWAAPELLTSEGYFLWSLRRTHYRRNVVLDDDRDFPDGFLRHSAASFARLLLTHRRR